MREVAVQIFRAALAAVHPEQLVAAHLRHDAGRVVVQGAQGIAGRWDGPTLVVGAGKAAARMAAGAEQALGAEAVRGEVIVADGCGADLQSVVASPAGHPLPDGRGAAAAQRVLALVAGTARGGILALISGGASSLMVCPRPPLTLADKREINRLLLEGGADIHELNTVRKHLSLVKGGGLLRAAHVPVVGLLISDVVGDHPGTIGSGPSAPDPTTFADACAVLARYGLMQRAPAAVVQMLSGGGAGRVAETVKPDSAAARRGVNVVIASNRTALAAAARAAAARGWPVHLEAEPLTGDTTAAARQFGARLRALAASRPEEPLCVLAGGETTVRVRGPGRGGRNQEFALALAPEIHGSPIVVFSAGTDGIDGPTDAAGAFVDGTTLQRAAGRGLSAGAALADNDAYTFFSTLGDLFCCGPTGTNVMDLKIALVPARRSWA